MHMHHGPVAPPDAPPRERLRLPRQRKAYVISAVLGVGLALYWTGLVPAILGTRTDLATGIFGTTLILYGAVKAALSGVIGADVALFLACAAAIYVGEPATAAVVAFMAFFGEALESIAANRAHRSIARLVELAPPLAHVLHDNHTHDVPIEGVSVGDLVVIRPGERVPVDGRIVSGHSSLDESSLTGESIPVERGPSDAVFAGTLNQFGALTVRTDRVGEDTTLGQVIRLVAEAQANKGEGERAADRYARRYFLPIVLAAALGTWLLTGSVLNSVAVLVIACPCALVLATPAAVLAAMGRLAGEGVLVKGGAVFERLAGVTTFAFDKTGTVTTGQAAVRRVMCTGHLSEDDALRLAATAESASEHVFARAILAEAASRGLRAASASSDAIVSGDAIADRADVSSQTVTGFKTRPGFGVEAIVDGRRVLVGNSRLLAEEGVEIDGSVQAHLRDLEQQGITSLLVARCNPHEVVAVIGVADTLREDAPDALHDLHHAGIEQTILLTGDRTAIARDIGRRLGIDVVHAEMLPATKADVVRRRQLEGERVAMVGDGINDAPALAVADVGLAIGGPGRDITADAADIVLMGSPLRSLPLTLQTARETVRIIRQNITLFAVGLNTVAVALAAFGFLPPMEAAVAHEIGSLAVLLNALRLLGFRRWGALRPVRAASKIAAAIDRAGHRFHHWRHDAIHWLHHRRRVLFWRVLPAAGLVAWASTSLRTVGVDQVGLVQRFGRALPGVSQPGLHLRWPWPIETIRRVRRDAVRVARVGAPLQAASRETFAIEWETSHPARDAVNASAAPMMTGDIWSDTSANDIQFDSVRTSNVLATPDDDAGVAFDSRTSTRRPDLGRDAAGVQTASKLVDITAVIHYAVADVRQYSLQVRSPDLLVVAAAESILRELVAGRRLDSILAGERAGLAEACREQLSQRLDRYEAGIRVLNVVLLDVHPAPGREALNVIEAYRDVARAQAQQRETVYTARTEAHRMLAESQSRRAVELAAAASDSAHRTASARGAAQRFLSHQAAFRTHPQLTRWRLFFKLVREKLSDRRKLILDPDLTRRQHLLLAGQGAQLSLTPFTGPEVWKERPPAPAQPQELEP